MSTGGDQRGGTSLLPVSPNRLADLLAAVQMSPKELAEASRVSLATVRRALRGAQTSARTRAHLVTALNARRVAQGLEELPASEVFPLG